MSENIISNRFTGQDIKFIRTAADTGGEFLEMETIYKSMSKEPVPHYHPFQDEDFEVLEGQVSLRIDGQVKVLQRGESFHIPANQVHSMWNNTKEKTVVSWKISPASDTESFLRTATELTNNRLLTRKGLPRMMFVALLSNSYSKVFRLAKPPFLVQKIVFGLLTPFTWLFGYGSTYKKYRHQT